MRFPSFTSNFPSLYPFFCFLLLVHWSTAQIDKAKAVNEAVSKPGLSHPGTISRTEPAPPRQYDLIDTSEFIGYIRMQVPSPNNYGEVVPETVDYTDIATEQLSVELRKYLLERKDQRWVGIERHKHFAYLSYSKLTSQRNGTFRIMTIKKGKLENLALRPGTRSGTRSTWATHSVLAPGSGKWYKIGVTNSGVFKIDYAFLKSMGIDPDTIDPRHINIYGNSAGSLPEAPGNNTSPDDLLKNAIYVQGESDGVFNTNDYVVFYAKSPVNVQYNTAHKKYLHTPNQYCDTSYYFLNISPTEPAKRVNTVVNTNIPNTTLTAFDEYLIHEINIKNYIKSGRLWVGEEFDIEIKRQFPIGFFNLKTDEPLKFMGTMAAYTIGASDSSTFKITIPEGGIVRHIGIKGIHPSTYSEAAKFRLDTFSFYSTSQTINLHYEFVKYLPDSKGWIDYFTINSRHYLKMNSNPWLLFRDMKTVGPGKITQFNLGTTNPNVVVWNVTSPSNAFNVGATFTGTSMDFVQNTDSLLEFVAFDPAGNLPKPFYRSEVAHQDLHGLSNVPYIIVTHPKFYQQALELSDLHASRGIANHVVLVDKVYNEFSSGMRDAAAIRNFMKMFYDRAGGDPLTEPKYLLLFGDGSYDNKSVLGMGQNYIPTHQSSESISLTASYTSDDYFGLLDDGELTFVNSDLLDLGVGRLVAKTTKEAQEMVDKIKTYVKNTYAEDSENCCGKQNTGNMGTWRNKIVLIADDEDSGYYVSDCESLSNKTTLNAPALEIQKIYLDATSQTSTPGGNRYFEAEALIKNSVQEGALIVNYVGHGGEVGWAHERILDVPTIQSWTNNPALPVFVTATCEFSRFDDPFRTSAGEYVLLNPRGGAVSMFTTTRLVFANANSALNNAFYDHVFDLVNNEPMHLGEVIVRTKNSLPSINNRNFTLLGDPAIQLKLPFHRVEIDSINGLAFSAFNDTLKALSVVTMSGHIEDQAGTLLSDFNGVIHTKVFDKIKKLSTLGQDPISPIINFQEWKNMIFKGRSTVKDGYFKFSFVVPKDLDQVVGPGRFVGYANDQQIDGHGQSQNFKTGGINLNAPLDNTGPEIEVYLNDDKFVDGGTANTEPYIIASFKDLNGINTVGTGIGHDITAVLDNETAKTIILNDKYEADKDSYQSGKVKFQLQKLTPGEHTLKIKAFDVYNNSSEKEIRFVVADQEELVLNHVLNYPNPFTTRTEFMFEHNYSCNYMNVQIQIFTISGKLVKTIDEDVNNTGFRVNGIYWDGKDDYGDKLARGTYIYRLKTRTNNVMAEKIERLVILY